MAEPQNPTGKTRRNSRSPPPRFSDPDPDELRLVLVGKTGAGKSSSGNTILGEYSFRAEISASSVTSECSKRTEKVFDRKVTVVDTPGLFDTSQSDELVKREISKCINMSAPGPHAILLVIKLGPFTGEEKDSVEKVEEIFGKNAWKHTMILFTHGDRAGPDFKQLLDEAPPLKEVLQKVGNRYHLFKNNQADDRRQVHGLLKKVDEMVRANGGKNYSNPTYLEADEMLKLRESELRKFYREKLEEKEKELREEYEKKSQEEMNQLKEEHESELREVKRYYRALESAVRHVVEHITKDDPFDEICKKFYKKLELN